MRYQIEAKDEFGWFDHSSSDNLAVAIAEARKMPCHVKVIDKQEMTVEYESLPPGTSAE